MDVKSIGVAAVGIVAVAAAAALSMRSDHTDERKTPHDGGPGDRDDEPQLVRGRLDVNDTSGVGLAPVERSGHARDDEIMRLGLYNLGNTCFMNAVLQVRSALVCDAARHRCRDCGLCGEHRGVCRLRPRL